MDLFRKNESGAYEVAEEADIVSYAAARSGAFPLLLSLIKAQPGGGALARLRALAKTVESEIERHVKLASVPPSQAIVDGTELTMVLDCVTLAPGETRTTMYVSGKNVWVNRIQVRSAIPDDVVLRSVVVGGFLLREERRPLLEGQQIRAKIQNMGTLPQWAVVMAYTTPLEPAGGSCRLCGRPVWADGSPKDWLTGRHCEEHQRQIWSGEIDEDGCPPQGYG